ncbi:MAG TPA: DUF4388 domain-containing protein [Thermoanaerobaculia bacterium]|jgi:hypothetical protein|nr:DUF4388 domain-containing protein [Thermoanaerobaculia bacterium]
MAVEGTLDLFKLPEILQLVSQQKKTGILTVQGQQDIVAISFLNGRIVAADALNTTLEEGLSQLLFKEGMISAPDLARATSEHQASGGRLIDLLVERRFIERSQLLEALRLQTYRLLEQILGWSQGDFKFYSGDEVSYEEGFTPIPVEELLINSAQIVVAANAAATAAARAAAPAPQPVPAPPPPLPAPPPRPVAVPAARADVPPEPVPFPGPRPASPASPRLGTVPSPVSTIAPIIPPIIPPDAGDAAGPFRRMKAEARPVPPTSLGWVGRSLAAVLTVLVIAALLRVPDSLLLPFPWQAHERETLVRDQRAALYLKIDRAAKTWFLLKGSFPDHLQDLVVAGLLSSADLKDPEGRPLQYVAGEESYTLQPLEHGRPVPGTEAAEAITGNFLLDPEVLSSTPESTATPLVLLD